MAGTRWPSTGASSTASSARITSASDRCSASASVTRCAACGRRSPDSHRCTVRTFTPISWAEVEEQRHLQDTYCEVLKALLCLQADLGVEVE